MAEMPLAGERDDEFEFLDHAMGPGRALSSQEEAPSAIARVGKRLAKMTTGDAANLTRVSDVAVHWHMLCRLGHSEPAGKTGQEDTGAERKQGQEGHGRDLRACRTTDHRHSLMHRIRHLPGGCCGLMCHAVIGRASLV